MVHDVGTYRVGSAHTADERTEDDRGEENDEDEGGEWGNGLGMGGEAGAGSVLLLAAISGGLKDLAFGPGLSLGCPSRLSPYFRVVGSPFHGTTGGLILVGLGPGLCLGCPSRRRVG